MEGESTLICPVGLVKPFLTLIRGERPHFVAAETVEVPTSPTNGSRQQKEACCVAVSSENPAEPVKRVRIAHCTCCFSNLFTS